MKKNSVLMICILFMYIGKSLAQKVVFRDISSMKSEDRVMIDSSIEVDAYYRKILTEYIHKSIWGISDEFDGQRVDYDTLVFTRPSFLNIVLMIYDNKFEASPELRRFIYDNSEGLVDRCRNFTILHMIADSLLSNNNFYQVNSLWDNITLDSLKNLDTYIEKNRKNSFIMSEISIIAHNKRDYKRANRYSNMIQDKKLRKKVKYMCYKFSYISHSDFMECIYYTKIPCSFN